MQRFPTLFDEFNTGHILQEVPISKLQPGPLRRISNLGLAVLKKSIEEIGLCNNRLPILAVPISWLQSTQVWPLQISLTCKENY